jgi:hypothetical protein
MGGAGADVLAGGAGSDRFVFGYDQLAISFDNIVDFTAGSGAGADTLDLDAVHLGNLATPVPAWPAAQYPYSLGYIRLQQDGPDVVVGYDRDGYNNEFFFKPVVTLSNVDASSLTPDNFTTGAQNFGFQRNGALLAIKSQSDSAVQYEVRLWGGSPSSTVTVVLTSTQSSAELGRVSYTAADWTATKSLSLPIASASRRLEDLTVRIESADTAYQGTGVVLGTVDGALLAERQQIIRPELSAFAAGALQRSLELGGVGIGLPGSLPSTLDLVPISGPGSATTANVTTVDSSRVRLSLNASSAAWEGDTEYLAMGINASGQPVRIRLLIEQTGNYKAALDTAITQANEGSVASPGLFNAVLRLDKPALSDVLVGWQVVGAGARPASADDFVGSAFPSGQVTVKTGQSLASIVVPIKGDGVQESDETFAFNLTSNSESIVSFKASPVFKIANDDAVPFAGGVRYWHGSQLVDGVGITLVKSVLSAAADDSVMIKDVVLDASKGIATASLWYDGTSPLSNFNLTFAKNGDTNFSAQLNSVFTNPAQWNTFINDSATSYRVTSISLQSVSSPVKILDLQFSLASSGQGVVLSSGVVGEQTVQEVQLLSKRDAVTKAGLLAMDITAGQYSAMLSKGPLSAAESEAIDSRDALEALQVAAGLKPSTNGFQILAADVDRNGVVQVKDAWSIARYSVGLPNTSQVGEWVFLDETADLSAITPGNATIPTGAPFNPETWLALNSGWVALVLGDVDGSLSKSPYMNW